MNSLKTLSFSPWHFIYQCKGLLVTFNILISITSKALETQAKIFLKNIRNCKYKNMLKNEWFDEDCKTELIRKENALKTYQKYKTSSNWDFYTKKRQSLSNLIKVKK